MDLAGGTGALVDGTDLRREEEAHRRLRRPHAGEEIRDATFVAQAEKAGLGRFQLFFQASEPAGVGKVTGTDDLNPLDPRPRRQTVKVAVGAGGAGKRRMDVQIGDVVHYSTVTLLARLRGWSTSVPLRTAT